MNNLIHLLFHFPDKENKGIKIFSEQNNSRLNYTCEFIFNQVLKVNFEIITDKDLFQKSSDVKINFSEINFENCINIIPHHFIFETTLSNENFEIIELENSIELISVSDKKQLDLFSKVFYFISRFEEWQNFERDAHGRFEAKASILFKHNLNLKPLVDIWIHNLKIELCKFYPHFIFPSEMVQVISTIDVDNVYAFKSKGLIRTLGAFCKDLLKFDFKNFSERFKVVFLNQKDPFDIYKEITVFCRKNNIPLVYFFLFKSGTKYDRTLNPLSDAFKRVFKIILRLNAQIGIHPSYHSSSNPKLFVEEKNLLQKQSQSLIQFSRQHFLKFDIKSTPKVLIENGIMADFTMGFASAPGFRAGTSFPFYYYDFSLEIEANLLLVPFCAMDGAFTVYKPIEADAAFLSLQNLHDEIKKVGGFFITVYHERSFYNHLYKNYGELYKKIHLHALN